MNAERRITDSRSREKSLRELEFNDLNIHLYLTLNYGTASEHLDFDFMVLLWGLTITPNSIHRISDLDRSLLSDTRSAENDRIGADTDPEYWIDASLDKNILQNNFFCVLQKKDSHRCLKWQELILHNYIHNCIF